MKPLPFDISNDTLNILIGIATFAIAFISFAPEINENRFKFFKSLSFRIVYLILFSFIIIWASVVKDKNNDVRNSNDVLQRSLVNQKNFNASLKVEAKSTAETMAKYYLLYKAAQTKVEELVRDSSKRKILIKKDNNNNPQIEICDLAGIRVEDTLEYDINICTRYSTAYNVRLKYCVVLRFDKVLQFYNVPYDFNLKQPLTSPGYSFIKKFYFNSLKELPQAYFYVYGSFTDSEKVKHTVSLIESYSFIYNKGLDLSDKEYSWITDFISKNGIKVSKPISQ